MKSLRTKNIRKAVLFMFMVSSVVIVAYTWLSASDQPLSQSSKPLIDKQQSSSSATPTGTIFLTTGSMILEYDLVAQKICAEWTYPQEITFAVPFSDHQNFIVVSGGANAKGYQLVRFSPATKSRHVIGEYKKIGVPVFSPDETTLTWVAELLDGTTVIAWIQPESTERLRTLTGNFLVNNSGPSWSKCTNNHHCVVVSTKDGYLTEVDFEEKSLRRLIKGDYPQVTNQGAEIFFVRDDAIRRCDQQGKQEKVVCNVGYIAPFYRAFKLSPDDSFAMVRTLAPISGPPSARKSVPATLLVDLKSGSKSQVGPKKDMAGPWRWLPSHSSDAHHPR